ncbi:putative monooxygenase [Lentzea sp. NBRC 105346]|uniref:acyl-CoA dehydrogenase family protein n=1 Tax=Lentzea sp. NBRC 105346 TaxID=3032205 RepID=UPI0024A50841|nr:acyl-CoA dehydrogenase family protein [Lentzea sp. NBRC 105346]GLZ31082.1 putative monooxygenase [Lentzea sp. NBRC 105346]
MTSWPATAQEFAARLRSDAADRDRANQPPVKEVELLRQTGLLDETDWSTQQKITRIVGAADANIGHLLGYHYLQIWRSGLFDKPVRHESGWFWAGVSNPLDAALELTPAENGFLVNGRKTFATGAAVADRLVVSATRTDNGEKLTFMLDGAADGITYLGDWDNIGQKLTASGGVAFENVVVPNEDVLGVQPIDEHPRLSLAALGFQLVLAQLYVAIAEGALAEAAEYTRTKTRPWFVSNVGKATEDPHILASYGEMVAQTQAAGLLADQASDQLKAASDQGAALTKEQRGEAAVAISAAKVVSTKVANEVSSRIFEQVGARGTAAGYALDRFWRNARTLTLHDPVVYKAREVGEHFLTGEHPAFTGYS